MGTLAPLVKIPGVLGRLLRRSGGLLLDQIYPPVCLNCQAPVAEADSLCAACFRSLRPITKPYCSVLGIPFQVFLGHDAVSAEALADPPPFGRARAAVIYNEVAAGLVSQLKYGDRPELARFCARLMAPAGHELWADKPVLLPVPLHRSRQVQRRYNQSAELALALGALTGLSVDMRLLRRPRKTRQQVGLTADQRHRNVAGAFSVDEGRAIRAMGRRVVIIDDVLTTGSTVRAVTQTLKRAGFDKIDVMTFARVVIGADLPI
ncbi:MAG TPA: ComF family protein [Devosiaceae bacterium]|jgi:ComF family protein